MTHLYVYIYIHLCIHVYIYGIYVYICCISYYLCVRVRVTRLNIGRPQVRWQDGCAIARGTQQARTIAIRGQNARTVGTIIKELFDAARAFVNRGNRVAQDP